MISYSGLQVVGTVDYFSFIFILLILFLNVLLHKAQLLSIGSCPTFIYTAICSICQNEILMSAMPRGIRKSDKEWQIKSVL